MTKVQLIGRPNFPVIDHVSYVYGPPEAGTSPEELWTKSIPFRDYAMNLATWSMHVSFIN